MNHKNTTPSFDLFMGAVGKSGRVLWAFTEFYLYFYGIEPKFLFQHFPVFGCISTAIYCVDESIEQSLSSRSGVGVDDLEELLAKRIELSAPVLSVLCDAREYCAFERSAREGPGTYDLNQVLRVSEIRSVDFRLMHHALLQIAAIPYDEEVFEWFRAFEVLMEIEDDLPTIKEDERRGSYNYYNFVRRVTSSNVEQIVESTRTSLEQRLEDIGASLNQRGMMRCRNVVEGYRRIVPRHCVPVSR
jgi:hypothetical protein